MIEIKITEEKIRGYSDPVYSWLCPLCQSHEVPRDLDNHYVRDQVVTHLVEMHNTNPYVVNIIVERVRRDRAPWLTRGPRKSGKPSSSTQ